MRFGVEYSFLGVGFNIHFRVDGVICRVPDKRGRRP